MFLDEYLRVGVILYADIARDGSPPRAMGLTRPGLVKAGCLRGSDRRYLPGGRAVWNM